MNIDNLKKRFFERKNNDEIKNEKEFSAQKAGHHKRTFTVINKV